ncbi:MAG: hypothetical protein WD341_05300 [Tistlia sp.]|uniref:hypothetical protein n=1 Tax=Tistlia sp. TaxID=3057121 RepID=UPI0034A5A129
MRSPIISGVLAAVAAPPLFFAVAPAEAGDWRRHHQSRSSGIILGPGVVLQLGPTYHAPAPRYRHDRRAHWHDQQRWHAPPRYHGRHRGWERGRHDEDRYGHRDRSHKRRHR